MICPNKGIFSLAGSERQRTHGKKTLFTVLLEASIRLQSLARSEDTIGARQSIMSFADSPPTDHKRLYSTSHQTEDKVVRDRLNRKALYITVWKQMSTEAKNNILRGMFCSRALGLSAFFKRKTTVCVSPHYTHTHTHTHTRLNNRVQCKCVVCVTHGSKEIYTLTLASVSTLEGPQLVWSFILMIAL